MKNKDLSLYFKENLINSLDKINNSPVEKEVGVVYKVFDSVIIINGLTKVGYDEAILISGKYYAFVAGMEGDNIKAVLLEKTNDIRIGDQVERTKKFIEIPVGYDLIGRVVNSLGKPIDNKGLIKTEKFLPAERPSKGVLDRKTVNTPLETGIKVIDCLIPIGKGQRELILGDRQTGKTSIAIDAILHQKGKDVICIYCAIGQRDSSVVNVIDTLQNNNALEYTIVLNSNATSLPGEQYLAPYSATTIAEFFCEQGKNVLIVYDDLSKHAKAYREISLLLERSPGREAYPGDIFYLHSRLLERSINLRDELGGGSITSLPIVETEAENISAYIPTNVISITDGQLYLSPTNFQKGLMPAIDIGKSVSRIGGKAQLKAFKQAIGKIGIEYSQFEELEMFSKFATKLDDETQRTINRGNLIREILKQDKNNTISMEGQIGIFLCINNNLFDLVKIKNLKNAENDIIDLIENNFFDVKNTIRSNEKLSQEQINTFLASARIMLDKYKMEV